MLTWNLNVTTAAAWLDGFHGRCDDRTNLFSRRDKVFDGKAVVRWPRSLHNTDRFSPAMRAWLP